MTSRRPRRKIDKPILVLTIAAFVLLAALVSAAVWYFVTLFSGGLQ